MKTEQIKVININNTKIANEIRKIKNLAGSYRQINVGSEKNKIIAAYGISENLSCFDMVVADAAYTLQVSGFENISAGQVMRVMSGNMNQSLSAAKKEKVEESMHKLMETMMLIDCQQEVLARGHIDKDSGPKIYRRFLPCEEISKKKYRFTGELPLYEYAEISGQMIAAPIVLLQNPDVEGVISDTWENVLIKRYLLQWLEIMKHENTYNGRKIIYFRRAHGGDEMYAGMLPQLDINRSDYASASSWNRKIGKVHEVVTKILDGYKKMGYIEGYSVIWNPDNEHRISGVVIEIKESKKRNTAQKEGK